MDSFPVQPIKFSHMKVFMFSPLPKVKVLVLQSCPTLCHPMDCSPPGSSVYGILQARILEWIAMPSSRDLPDPGIKPRSPELAGRLFTTSIIWEAPRGRVTHSNSQHTAVSPCLACTFSSRANSY